MFYKIIHHVVAIHPLDTLLLPTTTITRYNSSHTYQHIRTDKDSYKYSFYPRTIIQWNILPIHVNKSKYMLFNAGNKTLYPFEIKIDYISIERVYVFNFLGLIMDEHLNWKSHVEIFSNKCSKTIDVLNKLKYFFTTNS